VRTENVDEFRVVIVWIISLYTTHGWNVCTKRPRRLAGVKFSGNTCDSMGRTFEQ
jgi:hypothetical protein